MVDHQTGAHPGGGGDGADPNPESVLTELFDRGVADPGRRGQIFD